MNQQINLRAAPVLNKNKEQYFKKLILHTILGGYLFNDEESNIELSAGFHIVQFLFYIMFPAVVFICGLIANGHSNYVVGGIIPAVINTVINIILQVIAIIKQRSINENPLLIGENTKHYCNIIRYKTPLNLFYSIIMMGVLSFFAANFISKGGIAVQILTLITCLTSFYSLVSSSPAEFSSMNNNNTELGKYSTAHMRTQYFLVLLIINFCIDKNINQPVFTVLIPLLPLLWALGCLGSLYASTIYGIEKLSQYILGGSETSSADLRLVISAVTQLIVILIISIIVENSQTSALDKIKLQTLIASIMALLLSLNYLFHLGLIKQGGNKQNKLYIWGFKIGLLISSIVFPLVFDQANDGKTLCLISLIVFVINFISQSAQNAYLFVGLSNLTDKINRFLCFAQQIIYTASISQVCLNSSYTFSEYSFTKFEGNKIYIQVVLIYRMFHQTYTNPLITGLMLAEIYIYSVIRDERPALLLIYSPLMYITNYAISNFFKRILIWLYSILKMNQSKKQRIARLGLFNVLSFTLLLPINLIGIIISSIIDTPFLPFLGLPLYFIGFPRPKRFWPEVKRVVQNSGESLLYQKFVENFQPQFSQILRKKNVQVGEFYLIRIEKYLATVQILENGQNYAVIQLRGLESQEMTSCHSIEANQIDRIIEETYDKRLSFFKDCLGSIKPVQQFKVKAYEENQLQFTGVITDSGFVLGFKELLLKMLVYMVNQIIYFPEDEDTIDKLLASYGDYVLNQTHHNDKYPQNFSDFIQFDIFAKKDLHLEAIKKLQQMKLKEPSYNEQGKKAAHANPGFALEEDLDVLFGPSKSKLQTKTFQEKNKDISQPNKNIKEQIFNKPTDNKHQSSNQINDDIWGKNNAHKIGVSPIQNQMNIIQKDKNDLDDLLDDLSVKSNKNIKQEKKENKVPINNPFNIPKQNQLPNNQNPNKDINIELENNLAQSRHIKTPIEQYKPQFVNNQFQPSSNIQNDQLNRPTSQATNSQYGPNATSIVINNNQAQLNSLHNASRVTSQHINNIAGGGSISTQNNNNSELFQQIQAPILNSQQFNINPKRENNAIPAIHQSMHNSNQFKQQMNPIKDEDDEDDIDKYLQNMMVDDDKKLEVNHPKTHEPINNLHAQNQNQNNFNLEYNNNNNINNANNYNNRQNTSYLHQSMQQASDSKLQGKEENKQFNIGGVQKQLNMKQERDDLDNFLDDLLSDKRPKAQAPPPMMLNLEDDLNDSNNINNQNQRLNTNQNNISQKNTMIIAGNSSQSNTRVSGERSPKEIANNNGTTSKQMEKIKKLVYLLFSILTNDSNFDKQQIDQELLFKCFKDNTHISSIRLFKNASKNQDFSKIYLLMNKAIRYAIKIAYDTFAIMGSLEDIQNQDLLDSIKENDTDCQIGMGSDPEWNEGIQREVSSLWSLHYNHAERGVSIFRSQFKEINCNIFTLDENVVTSIWANLVFELYYATNDDDERYSIQTHEQFFRNLIIQNSEEPLGYAPFYSGPTLIEY